MFRKNIFVAFRYYITKIPDILDYQNSRMINVGRRLHALVFLFAQI